MNKKSILKKTVQFGSFTFLSRLLGLAREMLQSRYVGTTNLAEAFIAAFSLPNSLRKIFAEGALTAAFVPTFVKILKRDGRENANGLMSVSFLFFEGLVLFLCLVAFFKAEWVIKLTAPGYSAETNALAVPMLKILTSFILFVSSSALLAGALQAVDHFIVPASSSILLNIFFIAGMLMAWKLGYSIEVLCYAIIIAGFVQFLLHLFVYFRLGFRFGKVDKQSWENLKVVLWKFLPVMFSMSVMEVNFLVDRRLASYFPKGVALLYYPFRFMGIALGVFAVAFSTVLLPHLTRVSSYAPKRLHFYLVESAKFVLWIILPIVILMSYFSEDIFATFFMNEKFPLQDVLKAKQILQAFSVGLFFFSINKILLNIYYALHDTWTPAIISVIGTIANILLNLLLMRWFQTLGLAIATTISGAISTILLILLLKYKFNFKIYFKPFRDFALRYLIQLGFGLLLFFLAYFSISFLIAFLPQVLSDFFLNNVGLWFWVGPLGALLFIFLFKTQQKFGIKLYFLS